MRCRLILLLLLMQIITVTKTSAQFFGISEGAVFTPVSTLDVRGSFGAALFKDVSSNSNATANAAITLNSTVIFSNLTGDGRTSLQIPAPSNVYLNRVYIIVNAPSTSGGKSWDIANGVFYYDLFNAKIATVPLNSSVMIICNGTDWLQIN